MINTRQDDCEQQVAPSDSGERAQAEPGEQSELTLENNNEPEQMNDLELKQNEPTERKACKNLEVPSERRTRTGSVVSFKEECELFEIDIENGRNNKQQKAAARKPPAVFSLRYYVMLLALVSPFVVTYSKTIINFAIIDMIHPDHLTQNSAKLVTETPQTSLDLTKVATNSTLLLCNSEQQQQQYYFQLDNSCPVSDDDRDRLIQELNRDRLSARELNSEKFEWDTVKQGQLKAAYSIGHMMLQIVGGRLSEIYGSHLIMCASSSLIAVACFAAPYLASLHFYLMFLDLLLLGVLGSFMTPALITLFSNWLTPSEKSFMLTFYLVSSRLGYALSAMLCGLLIDAQLSWRYLFYSAGWTALAFGLLFWFVARSKPHEHPLIKSHELEYLASKNTLVREAVRAEIELRAKTKLNSVEMEVKNRSCNDKSEGEYQANNEQEGAQNSKSEQTNRNVGAPWLALLTNCPVWAFVITKFCVKLAGDTVQVELPTYLNRVMHFSARRNGTINASNYVIFCTSCLLVGALAKYANKKHPFGWSKTAVRKLFQCTASFGVGSILILVSTTICQSTITVILLMLLFVFTTFSTGGEAQIPLDISERYAGTIHAIGSSLAISGAIEPIIVGFLLRGQAANVDSWRLVWLGSSAFAFLGGLVFLIFGDATIQQFDKIGSKRAEKMKREAENGQVNLGFEAEKTNYKSVPIDQNKPTSVQEELHYKESQQI